MKIGKTRSVNQKKKRKKMGNNLLQTKERQKNQLQEGNFV